MSHKVLVVDDSGTMRKIIIRTLKAAGVTDIVEAGNGDEAWEFFQQEEMDLVLTDWNMPGKSGLELLKCIRDVNVSIPVVFITMEAEKSRVLQAIQAGVSDYLVKPFEAEALRTILGKALKISAPPQTVQQNT